MRILRKIWNTWWLCILVGAAFWFSSIWLGLEGYPEWFAISLMGIGVVFLAKGSELHKFIFSRWRK